MSKKIESLFKCLAEHNPHPTTVLTYNTPFQLLVAVVLSAQTTDAQVNRVTPHLFQRAPDPQTMSALSLTCIETLINRLGLYRNKARFLKALSTTLVKQYNGILPKEREALMQLPGVGRKTAHVVMNTLYDAPVIAVDTHVFRVTQRLGLAFSQPITVRSVENDLMQQVPIRFLSRAHHDLIHHGRTYCQAKKPHCTVCPVSAYCDYYKEHV